MVKNVKNFMKIDQKWPKTAYRVVNSLKNQYKCPKLGLKNY